MVTLVSPTTGRLWPDNPIMTVRLRRIRASGSIDCSLLRHEDDWTPCIDDELLYLPLSESYLMVVMVVAEDGEYREVVV